jgi:hypothetical protein
MGPSRCPVRLHPRVCDRRPWEESCWLCEEGFRCGPWSQLQMFLNMTFDGKVGGPLVLPRKSLSPNAGQSSSSSALITGLLSPYPELWAFLTASAHPDGTKRQTGRMSWSCERGCVKCSLTDEETNAFVCRSGSSVDELLALLERHLVAGTLEWIPSNQPARRKR